MIAAEQISMTRHVPHPTRMETGQPAIPIGMPTLVKVAFDGSDLAPIWNMLIERVRADPRDAAALVDLSSIALLQGRPKDRIALQNMALELQRIYRQPPKQHTATALKVLAFMGPGDFMDSMPIEFLLEHSAVNLDMIYVSPELPLPNPLPEHDVALVCVGESRKSRDLLHHLSALLADWPRPVINRPERIARLTRVGTWELLRSETSIVIPMQADVDRPHLAQLARKEIPVADILHGNAFPIIARPADSHAGEGLAKLDSEAEIITYLRERPEREFCIAPFVDYRGKDGLFRKYRVVLIGGCPYAVHMAISHHWMIHYLNADMRDSEAKRAEEAEFMANFDSDFAVRHKNALSVLAQLADLEYLPFDCGETPDGKLLVFETGTNMIVHSMDPDEIFPYKRPQMNKVFAAFQDMLQKACEGNHRNLV